MPVKKEQKRIIRIFTASPYDVEPEQECLREIVEHFNRTGDASEQPDIRFQLHDFRDADISVDGESGSHGHIPVEKWDIFIGVLWLRFGPPEDDEALEEELPPDREADFQQAYEHWKRNGRPHVLFYRCHRPHPPLEIDIDQLKKVKSFFERFERDGQHPGIFKIFEDTPEFKTQIQQDLIDHLKRFESKSALSKGKLRLNRQLLNATPEQFAPNEIIVKKLTAGKVYNLALLSIDIVDHSQLFKTYQSAELKELLDKFYKFVFSIIREFNGDQMAWAGDGGIFAFWGEGACDNAVLAGIKLLLDKFVFNLQNSIKLLKDPIKIRLAAHYGSVEFDVPTDHIHSSHINFVAHLEKNGTAEETFSITKNLRDELNECIQNVLAFYKKYQNTYIYTYKLPSEKEFLSQSDLENILVKIKDQAANLLAGIRMAVVTKNDTSDFEAMRRNIDSIYNNVEHFTSSFAHIDINWSDDYFKTLIHYASAILEEDENLNRKIDEIYFKSNQDITGAPGLFDVVKFLGVRKTNAIPNIRMRLKQFHFHFSGHKEPLPAYREDLETKIDNFIGADDFSEEMTFFEMFLNDKKGLIDYVTGNRKDSRHRQLVNRLWKLADFILIEDITQKRQFEGQQLFLIFPVLSHDEQVGFFFKVIMDLFRENLEQSVIKQILERFETYNIKLKESDLIIVLKCLLIGCTNPEARKKIVEIINFRELWDIIAYKDTPLEVIEAIAEHLYRKEDGHRMKVFFDLTLNKLLNTIRVANNEQALFQVKRLILVFYHFDLFSESGYYERLEDLRLNYASKSHRFPATRLDIMENYFNDLKNRRGERLAAHPHSSIPDGLGDIPLPVQRRLAGDGHYIEFFADSPNQLVALDTIRHINADNIARILRSPNVNEVLLGWLLKNKELFRSEKVITLALNHPKCTPAFASRYLPRLPESKKKQFAVNAKVNAEVRAHAEKLLTSS